jgi:hypothetical protein
MTINILVIGLGSMGKRRIRCLRTLGSTRAPTDAPKSNVFGQMSGAVRPWKRPWIVGPTPGG